MSYSDLLHHQSMVFDEVRNRAYLRAMEQVITPESVVLDLGAGIGVLGLLAAKAGAKRVYCVEPSPVAMHIPALAKANGVGDRVVALRGRIEEVALPEQVDVLLSVFTGNLLFTEDLLPSLYHARDRWLKPGGVMIPDRARLHLGAAEVAEEFAKSIARYDTPSLGIDYGTLASSAANALIPCARNGAQPRLLTPPVLASDLDLSSTDIDGLSFQTNSRISVPGIIHALLGWIEIRLGDAWLSTAPDQPAVHWSPMLLPFRTPMSVNAGESVEIGLRYVDHDQIFWSLGVNGLQQRQSTVLGNPQAMLNLMLSSPERSGPLSDQGVLMLEALKAMARGESNRMIAEAMLQRYPRRFANLRQAQRSVGRWASGYRARPNQGI